MKLVLSEDWTGTAAELAERLTELLPEYGLPAEPVPNERLVRFYVTSGALTRPRKEGREALFGYRQVVEFLATRVLLGDGWPLAKAAEYIVRTETSALLALLPQDAAEDESDSFAEGIPVADIMPAPVMAAPAPVSPPGTKAEQLITRFRQSLFAERKQAEEAPQRSAAAPASAPPPPAAKAAPPTRALPGAPPMEPDLPELAKRQVARTALRELGHTDTGPERETWIHIEIAQGCEVHLRPSELERYRKEKAETHEALVENMVRVFRTVIESEFARKGNR